MTTNQGRKMRPITYIDIPATDRHRTADFYAAMFGWTFDHHDDANHSFYTPPAGVGGGYAHYDDESSIHSRLVPQVDSDDPKADLERALRLNATLLQDELDVGVGRYTMVSDPAGNPLSMFKLAHPSSDIPVFVDVPGAIIGLVYPAEDHRALADFYRDMLGWGPFDHDAASGMAMGHMQTIGIGFSPVDHPLNDRGRVIPHIRSLDVAGDLDKAEQLGGRMLAAETLPDGQLFGLFADPSGVAMALLARA